MPNNPVTGGDDEGRERRGRVLEFLQRLESDGRSAECKCGCVAGARETIDLIHDLEALLEDGPDPDPALWPNAMRVCVGCKTAYFFAAVPESKCLICGTPTLEFEVMEGDVDGE
jgi:hypothetical protein